MKKKFLCVFTALYLGTLGMPYGAAANPDKWISSLIQDKKSLVSRNKTTVNAYTLLSVTNIGTAPETVTVRFLNTDGSTLVDVNQSLATGAVLKLTTAGGGGPSETANWEGYLEVSTADGDAGANLLPWAAILFGPFIQNGLPASAVSVDWAKK